MCSVHVSLRKDTRKSGKIHDFHIFIHMYLWIYMYTIHITYIHMCMYPLQGAFVSQYLPCRIPWRRHSHSRGHNNYKPHTGYHLGCQAPCCIQLHIATKYNTFLSRVVYNPSTQWAPIGNKTKQSGIDKFQKDFHADQLTDSKMLHYFTVYFPL